MATNDKPFDIIRFTPDSRQYYPVHLSRQNWMEAKDVRHTEIDILLGHSRSAGPVINIPEGFEMPAEPLRFAAQLDPAAFAPHDSSGRLPTSGQLQQLRVYLGTKLIATNHPSCRSVSNP